MRDKLAVLNITSRCNHDCVFCSDTVDHDQTSVPFEQVAEMFDQLRARDYNRVHFMGGETTLRKDFFELAELARSKGFVVGLATNGVRFANREFAERAMDRLAFLELSLVSPDRSEYRAVTGKDHQPRMLRALDHIMELRRGTPRLVPLTLNVVTCSLNRRAPVETVKLLADMDLPKGTFLVLVRARCHGHAQERKDVLLDAIETAETFRPALEVARQLGVPTMFRGLPTCALVEFAGHNNDAVDALLNPSVACMNNRPIHEGIDIDAHRDTGSYWSQRMNACTDCPLAAVCRGLDEDLPSDRVEICPRDALPSVEQVRQALRDGPMGKLLTQPLDGSWPPPLD